MITYYTTTQTITFTMRVVTSYHSLLPTVTSSSSAPDSGTGISVSRTMLKTSYIEIAHTKVCILRFLLHFWMYNWRKTQVIMDHLR
jgi:hypothetical protein